MKLTLSIQTLSLPKCLLRKYLPIYLFTVANTTKV